jgi:hypothetical protein
MEDADRSGETVCQAMTRLHKTSRALISMWKHEGVWYSGVRMHKEARLNTNEMLTKTVQTGHPCNLGTGEEPMLRHSMWKGTDYYHYWMANVAA